MDGGETMQNKVPVSEPKGHRKLSKKLIALIAVVVVIVLGVAAALTGRMAIVFKAPDARVVVQPNICGDSFVTRYNDSVKQALNGVNATSVVGTVVQDFDKLSGNDKDPSCAYIRFRYALMTNDYETAQRQLDIMSDLAAKGSYADMRLNGMNGIDSLRVTLHLTKPTDETGTND